MRGKAVQAALILVILIVAPSMGASEYLASLGSAQRDFCGCILGVSGNGCVVGGYGDRDGSGNLDISFIKFDADGTLEWAHGIGGPGADYCNSVKRTADNGFVLAGTTNSFGQGGDDFLIIKTSSAGNRIWSRTAGGAGFDRCNSVCVTADGGCIAAGQSTSFGGGADFLLVKFDSNGTKLWAKTAGGPLEDFCTGIEETPDGGFVAAGYSSSFGDLNFDVLLIKFDPSGNPLWAHSVGGPGFDTCKAVRAAANGDLLLAGQTSSFGSGLNDLMFIRFNAAGTLLKAFAIGDAQNDLGVDIYPATGGSVLMAGSSYSFGDGSQDAFLVKLDSTSNLEWARTGAGSNSDEWFSVSETDAGNILAAGNTKSYGAGDYDLFTLQADGSGNIPDCDALQDCTPNSIDIAASIVVADVSPAVTMPAMGIGDPSSVLQDSILTPYVFEICGTMPPMAYVPTIDPASASVFIAVLTIQILRT